jgi:hypothetical protein
MGSEKTPFTLEGGLAILAYQGTRRVVDSNTEEYWRLLDA